MANPSVEPVLSARARLGECPLWDPERQRLHWVDIYNHRVHSFDPRTGGDQHVDVGDTVGSIALAGDGRLLIALSDRIALLDVDTGSVTPLQHVEFSRADTRFNDGRCDPQGRFWVGSISTVPGHASLYRYDPDGSLHIMETGLTISNGLGWSPDGQTFYLTDSPTRCIYAYRFDGDSGAISDRRVFVELADKNVEPDGLAIDQRGHLLSALWNGWCVVRFDPSGRELERIPVPVQCPTALAFGGAHLTDLYVTSASVGLSQADIQRGHQAGDLFRVSGLPPGLAGHAFAARRPPPAPSTGEPHAVRQR
jgi:sugar lactone lactonase YvrE